MWARRASGRLRPRLVSELRERESVRPLELFFDLAFVLAFTQCTALMASRSGWSGIGEGLLVLAVLWWSWVGYAWLTSVIEPEEGSARLIMLTAMAGLLVVALCVPEAFSDRALTFAIAYGIVRLGNIILFFTARPLTPGLRRWLAGFAVTTAIVVALLVVAAFADGALQIALWLAAIAMDSVAPALSGVDHWRLVPAHFAERHNLVIILALGESIIALGVGAQVELTSQVIAAAVLGMGLAAALWWIYFDVVAIVTERRLMRATEGRSRNALARDSYSYLHFPMVAGIVLTALGIEETLPHVTEPLHLEHAAALLGGTAMYLLAHVALRLRNAHTINVERLGAAVLLLALIPVAARIDAIISLAAVVVLLWGMIAYETVVVYDDRRSRLRHGLEVDVPGTYDGSMPESTP